MYTSKFAEERALRTQKRLELNRQQEQNQVKKRKGGTEQIMRVGFEISDNK